MDYDACSEYDMSRSCKTHGCSLENCIYESLSFSACGRYILAKTSMFSAVRDISLYWSTNTPGRQLEQSRSDHAAESKRTNPTAIQKMSDQLGLVGSSLRPGELINQSSLVTNGNGDAGLLRLSSGNQNVTVDVSGGLFSCPERSLQLLTLPASFDTRDTAISVRLPEPGEETVRLIFNKTAPEFFELNRGELGLPSVTERNIRALYEVTPMHLLEDEGISDGRGRRRAYLSIGDESCEDEEHADDETRNTRKRKRTGLE